MTLPVGSRLGPYEIGPQLGAGGMGEVFRARDTKLNRDVAIKVLPAGFAEDKERVARFRREAQLVASLNHPNIAAIYGLEESNGNVALALELVDGEDLAQRLARGPIPVDEAIAIARQIADGLEAAHERGIVHRDLKPANVKLTRAGTVKILDFGLAKAYDGEPGASDGGLTNSPTISRNMTEAGVILGTAAYMSPEQARGRPVDKRADIWSFGVVLFEMLTARPPFTGQTVSEILAAVIKDPPDLNALGPSVPPGLRRLIERCLRKDPRARLRDIGDARLALEETGAGEPLAVAAPPALPKRAGRERAAWLLFAAATITAVALGLALRSAGRSKASPVFTAITYKPMALFRAAFAPDGKTIVYSAALEGNTPRLFVIRPENPEPQPFGDPGTHLLSVSSRGEMAVLTGARFLGHRLFTGTLARMPVGGGAPREILENVRDADWAPDGSQAAIIREIGGKDRLEFPIDHVLYESDGYLSDLRFSPKGDAIAFFEHPWRFDDRGSVNKVDLRGKKTLLSDGYWGEEGIAWSRDGGEVLFSASVSGSAWTIYSVPATGTRRTALQSAGGQTIHDVNAEGRWLTTSDNQSWSAVVRTPARQEDRDVSWLDSSLYPHLSEDGKSVLFTEQGRVGGNNYAACLRKTEGGDVVRLGDGITWDLSADGRKALAMISSPPQVVVYPTGAGEPRRLERGSLENYGEYGKFLPRDDSILFWGNEPGKAPRYFVQSLAGGPPRAVTPEGTREGVLSRDGALVLAKASGGKYQIYPLTGGEPHPVPSLTAEDVLIRTSADGRSVLCWRAAQVPARVERVDLQSGHRSPFGEMAPADRTGLLGVFPTLISDDERSYAYWTWRLRSTLFTVDWER